MPPASRRNFSLNFSANTDALVKELVRLNREINKLKTNASKSGEQLEGFTRSMGNSLGGLRTQFNQAGVAIAAFGVALAAPFALGIKSITEYELALARARAILFSTTDEMTDDYQRLIDITNELAKTTIFSATEAANALRLLAMAGLSAHEAIAALPVTLKLAQVGALDVAKAADLTTNILTAFKFEATEIGIVGDKLAAVFTSANTNLIELASGLKYVAPIAVGVGNSFEDLLASVGRLADSGIKASLAGTSLRGALSALFNPTREEAKLLKELAARVGDVNFTILDAQGAFIGFIPLVRKLEESGVSAAEALELFGLRAGPALASLIGIGSESLAEFEEQIIEAKGTLEKAADTVDNTLSGSFKKLKNNLDVLMRSIIGDYVPAIKSFVNGLKDLVQVLQEFKMEHPLVVRTVVNMTLAISALAVALGTLASSFVLVIVPIALVLKHLAKLKIVVAVVKNLKTLVLAARGVAAGIALTNPVLLAFIAVVHISTSKVSKLVSVLYEWGEAEAELARTRKFIIAQEKSIAETYRKLSVQIGIQIKNAAHLSKLIKDGIVTRDKETGQLINAAKIRQDEISTATRQIQQRKRQLEAQIEAIGLLDKENAIRSNMVSTNIELSRALGEITKTIADEQKLAEAVRRRSIEFENANEILRMTELAGVAGRGKVDELQQNLDNALITYKKAIIAQLDFSEESSKALDKLKVKAVLTDSFNKANTLLALNNSLYDQGQISVKNYLAEKRRLSTLNIQTEIDAIKAQIDLEEEKLVIAKLNIDLTKKETQLKVNSLKLDAEDVRMAKQLAAAKQSLISLEAQQASETAALTPGFDDDLFAVQEQLRARQDIERTAFEERLNIYETEAEAKDALRRHEAMLEQQRNNLFVAQAKEVAARRLDIMSTSASAIQGLFGTLYEATGENVKAFFFLERAAAAAQAVIQGEVAAMKVLAQGGAYAIPLSSVVRAQGYAAAGLILGQSLAGYKDGGLIGGSSPNDKADNLTIRATANEFMQPVSTVKYYGTEIMEALRRRMIPKELFTGFSLPSNVMQPNGAFNTGGLVTNTAGSNNYSITVPTNVSSPGLGALAGELQTTIEQAVLKVMKRELS